MVQAKKVRQKPKVESRSTLQAVGSAVIQDIRQSLNSSYRQNVPILLPQADIDASLALDAFRDTLEAKAIDQAVLISKTLEFRKDTPEVKQSHLLNLDSNTGRAACLSHLDSIKRLVRILEVKQADRDYRTLFTASYK